MAGGGHFEKNTVRQKQLFLTFLVYAAKIDSVWFTLRRYGFIPRRCIFNGISPGKGFTRLMAFLIEIEYGTHGAFMPTSGKVAYLI